MPHPISRFTHPLQIPLHDKGGAIKGIALVSKRDLEIVDWHAWCMDSAGYPGRRLNGNFERLHRIIMGLDKGNPLQVDHRNRNRLDCRRSNLRIATVKLNMQNLPSFGGTSRYRGVCWAQREQKWRAVAKLDGQQYHLGYFDDEDEAGLVAIEWRLRHMPFTVETSCRIP